MKRYRRNELQAREGIDTRISKNSVHRYIRVEMSYKPERALTRSCSRIVFYGLCLRRNELQAREGIDTLFYTFQNYHEPSVEMSYKPERALTQYSRNPMKANMPSVEMSYKPERALTPNINHVPPYRFLSL